MHLNDIGFDNIADWPWTLKVGFSAIVIVLVTFLFFMLDMRPLQQKIDNEKLNGKTLSEDLQRKEKDVSMLSSYQSQAQYIKNKNYLLIQQLPRTWNVPQIIQLLSKLGANRGLEFKAMKPQAEIVSPAYSILPIHISVHGSYHQLGQFVADIAQLKPIITLDKFTLQPATNSTIIINNVGKTLSDIPKSHTNMPALASDTRGTTQTATDYQQLQMDFTAHIYRQNPSSDTKTNTTSEPIVPIKPLLPPPNTLPATYDYPPNLNPFNPPGVAATNTFINQSDTALQRYPLTTLTMAGTLTRDSRIWALIVTPDGQVVRAGIGDELGLEKNRIIAITATETTLTADKSNERNNPQLGLVYLRLKLTA